MGVVGKFFVFGVWWLTGERWADDLCCRDERFLRELVGMLKREEGRKPAPWKTREGVCRRYHEHVGGGLCTGPERGRK